MSLLMDALKRAEDAKRQNAQPAASGRAPGATAAPVGGLDLALEPLSPSPLPELSEHVAEVEAGLRATADDSELQRPGPPPVAKIAAADQQAAARKLFSAKAGTVGDASSRKPIVILAAVTGLAALAVGAYFYYQYQLLSGQGPRLAAVPTTRPAPPAPLTTPVPSGTLAAPAAGAAAKPAEPVGGPAPRNELPAPPRTTPDSPPEVPRGKAREVPAKNAESAIRVTSGSAKLDPALAKGYELLQAGNFEAARDAYEQALRGDARNADALTGLAVIAVGAGQADRARALYAQALDADPKSVSALAGLIGLRSPGDRGDQAASESRLKSILASQTPGSAQAAMIEFALGNLYASQLRWNEAQSAYFHAYAADGGNPDYHYNLAVSLDHLQQTPLAVRFYRSALAAGRPAVFDRQQAEARLRELER